MKLKNVFKKKKPVLINSEEAIKLYSELARLRTAYLDLAITINKDISQLAAKIRPRKKEKEEEKPIIHIFGGDGRNGNNLQTR